MTVELLARRHGRSLKTIQIYNAASGGFACDPKFSALTSLDVGDVDTGFEKTWASNVVADNHKSLRHVKFGYEKDIALGYLGKWGSVGPATADDFTRDFVANIRERYETRKFAKTKPLLEHRRRF